VKGAASRGRTATISAHVVRAILAGAAARGLDPAALVTRFGIEPHVLADVDGRVPAALTVTLWEEVPRLANDPAFGLRLGETAGATALTLAGHLIQASATLRDGVRRMLAYYRVFNDVHPPELVEGSDVWSLRVVTRGTPLEGPRHAMEFAMAWLVGLARRTTGADVVPRAVHFEHDAPPDDGEHQRVFRCPVRFGAAHCGLDVDAAVLDLPHLAPDSHLVELLESHARGLMERLPGTPDFAARVRQVLYGTMKRGEGGVAAVARELHMSARSVQRYLEQEGTSYQAVLDELRRDLAVRYLADRSLTLGEVAFLLGFSDQAAFHRAFVRWTGVTPGHHRRGL